MTNYGDKVYTVMNSLNYELSVYSPVPNFVKLYYDSHDGTRLDIDIGHLDLTIVETVRGKVRSKKLSYEELDKLVNLVNVFFDQNESKMVA